MNNGLYIQKLKVMTFPFSSFTSYCNASMFEIMTKKNKTKKEQRKLSVFYDEIFEELREGFFTIKMDSINLMIERYWIQNTSKNDLMLKLNTLLAKEFLYLRNGKFYVEKSFKNDNLEKLEIGNNRYLSFEWYILKTCMNLDTIKGAYLEEVNKNNFAHLDVWEKPISTSNKIVEKVLEKGLAEQHMHLGASKSITAIWQNLMSLDNQFTSQYSSVKVKTAYGVLHFNNYLVVTRFIRCLLIDYFEEFSSGELDLSRSNTFERHLRAIAKKGYIKKDDLELIINKFKNGARFDLPEGATCLLDINKLCSSIKEDNNEKKWFLKAENLNYNENKFMLYVMKYLKNISNYKTEMNGDVEDISILLWQYIRLKNVFTKYIVQSFTSGKGLDIFSSIYGNQKNFKSENMLSLLLNQIAHQNISKLEVRISPHKDIIKMKAQLIDFFIAYSKIIDDFPNGNIPLLGIVYHFIKAKDSNAKKKCNLEYRDTNKLKYLSFGKEKDKYIKEAENINLLRSEIDSLDKYIVGIDAACKENFTEPYIFKDAYNIARGDYIGTKEHNIFVKELGFTYHVGEEFRDIISGLRHIDETFEILNFKYGDRIGHGIVLGIDIKKWADINSVIYIPAHEYIENLLWEWRLYTSDEEYKGIENIRFLETRILDTAKYIYHYIDGIRVEDLYEVYELKKSGVDTIYTCDDTANCYLQQNTKEKHLMKSDGSNYRFVNDMNHWDKRKLFNCINCSHFSEDLNKVVEVNISNSLILKYKKLQEYMKKKISDKGIIIETNPSSNLLIGEFRSFEDYHITNLSNPNEESVIISINTDDPIVFDTNLSNEFALIYEIVRNKEMYHEKDIINWLERIRKNGIEYSFVENSNLSKSEMKAEIKKIIGELKK